MVLYIWRHPKPRTAQGRCIGQTDIAVDKRKLKRLANKIERFVRLHQLPRVIWVSPLQRSLKVGQILAQRGFQYQVAPELAEINFGVWDGCLWEQITQQEIDDWCNDFAHFACDKGESLHQLFDRVEGWMSARVIENNGKRNNKPTLVVGHAGWITAAKMIADGQNVPTRASEWPRSVKYQERSRLVYL